MTQWGLDVLFNPAKRHMDEEKQRLQSTREEVGDASGGKRIDFESGKVVIRRGSGAAVPDETATDETAESVETDEIEETVEPLEAQASEDADSTEQG